MNSHWPYNIMLRFMQTFAGLRDSSLPDPGLAPTHYGTTKVTINYQCTEKFSTILSVEKRSDPYATHIGAVTLALILIMTIDRPCRQCSRSSICQLSWPVSLNPVNNWIQSNATSKVRMGLTSWPCRHIRLGRSCSQLISWQQLQYVWIETNFNSKVS